MNDKLNQEVILNQEDLLTMLDSLLEKWDEEWWNEFYSDKEKPIPFFIDLPDENLNGGLRNIFQIYLFY